MKKRDNNGKTATGLRAKLPSYVRTDQLFKLALGRGARLRMLRTLLHLTIEEFAAKTGQNAGTIGRIERGETCLSIALAKWFSRFAMEAGVLATSEWLLSSEGSKPQIVARTHIDLLDFLNKSSVGVKSNFSEEEIAQSASLNSNNFIDQQKLSRNDEDNEEHHLVSCHLMSKLFASLYTDHIIIFVRDYKMKPVYNKGEMLAGIKIDANKFASVNGQDVIIETSMGYMVRIFNIDQNNNIILSCHQSDSYGPSLVEPSQIKNIYRVLWKYIPTDQDKDFLLTELDTSSNTIVEQKMEKVIVT